MKFFVTLVPCCQSTKSVCHGCTSKNSTQFLPISEVFSNCVKHSLPERLNNILPDIHTGLSVFRCWISARCTRDNRPCPPCSGWRSGAGLPAGTSPTTGQGGPLLSRASQDLCYGASHNKMEFQKESCAKTERDCPLLHKLAHLRENYARYFFCYCSLLGQHLAQCCRSFLPCPGRVNTSTRTLHIAKFWAWPYHLQRQRALCWAEHSWRA